jgi:hypothetical protein
MKFFNMLLFIILLLRSSTTELEQNWCSSHKARHQVLHTHKTIGEIRIIVAHILFRQADKSEYIKDDILEW